MPTERQSSFAAGELAPEVWEQTQRPEYAAGAKTLRNFVVSPTGALVNRPGLQHIKTFGAECRLRMFTQAGGTYGVAVFTHQLVEVWGPGSGDPRHTFVKQSASATPYQSTDLDSLKFAQIGGVLLIACPGYALHELTVDVVGFDEGDSDTGNEGPGVNALSFYPFAAPGSLEEWGTEQPYGRNHDEGDYVSGDDGGETVSVAHNFPHVVRLFSLSSSSTYISGDAEHPARPWQWRVTYIVKVDGVVFETAPLAVNRMIDLGKNSSAASGPDDLPSLVAVYPDLPIYIATGTKAGRTAALSNLTSRGRIWGDGVVVASRIYRGRGGVFGYIGETDGFLFDDAGADPDLSRPPPSLEHPLDIYNSGALIGSNRPQVVAFHQERMLLAAPQADPASVATDLNPGHILASAVGDYLRFQETVQPLDTSHFSFQLASGLRQEVRAMVSKKKLMVFTDVGEWVVSGVGEDSLITPTSIRAEQIGENGCSSKVAPILVEDTVLFAQPQGTIRALKSTRDGYEVPEITALAPHLFRGYTVADWAFARHPFPVLWVVRSDGALLSCTLVPSRGVVAWAVHDGFGDGLVESVEAIPEGAETGVYLSINHSGTRSFGRFAYRVFSDIRQAVFLDRCVSYNGQDTSDALTLTDPSATGADIGDRIRATFATAVDFDTDALAGRFIQVDNPSGGTPVRLALVTKTGTREYDAQVTQAPPDGDDDPAVPAALIGTALTGWWLLAPSVSGLSHLEGQTVTAVADGNVIENLTVNGGVCDLGPNVTLLGGAGIAHVGLGYVSKFESLDAAQDRTRVKNISEAYISLVDARGGGEVGNELGGKMTRLKERQVSDGYNVMNLRPTQEKVPIRDQWREKGTVAYQHTAPTPVTVTAIGREVEYGGK